MIDIIPDIHGHAYKLTGLLTKLGYANRNGAWRHSNPQRKVVFLGDFIDRGPQNAAVISIVRRMIDAGTAQAVLGNHELNAIHFHTMSEADGAPLRPHTDKNTKQHGSFLTEHQTGSAKARDAVKWMKSLPCFLEFDGFRVVHACWNSGFIKTASEHLNQARLTEDAVQHSANPNHPIYRATENLLKGPEATLPDGRFIADKDGHHRHEVRLAWWRADAETWRDAAISVPEPDQLPTTPLPDDVRAESYGEENPPVFFGHYWMTGEVKIQSPNTFCLDYSAGLDGPLLAYSLEDPAAPLSLSRITSFGV